MEGNKDIMSVKEAEEIKPKGHYEVSKVETRPKPVYNEMGESTGFEDEVYGRTMIWVWTDEEELKKQQTAERSAALKAELAKIKEDIEQETFGLIRNDFEEKKARAADIINELRVLEGKEPREVKTD